MEEQKRQFLGIWIPKELWEMKELNCQDKCLVAEIQSLDLGDGCYASNKYFSEFFGITEIAVSNSISKLKKLGVLEQISFDGRLRKLKVCLKEKFKSDLKPTLTNNKVYNNIPDKSSISISDKSSIDKQDLQVKKISKKVSVKKPTQKEKLFYSLKEIIPKYFSDDDISNLLIRWLNSLYEVNKLPSSAGLEESLLQIQKLKKQEILNVISNSIRGSYKTFFIPESDLVSRDGISHELTPNYEDEEQKKKSDRLFDKFLSSCNK